MVFVVVNTNLTTEAIVPLNTEPVGRVAIEVGGKISSVRVVLVDTIDKLLSLRLETLKGGGVGLLSLDVGGLGSGLGLGERGGTL